MNRILIAVVLMFTLAACGNDSGNCDGSAAVERPAQVASL